MKILVLNPGSATLKFGVYEMSDGGEASPNANAAVVIARGMIEPIGAAAAVLKLTMPGQTPTTEPVDASTLAHAVERIIRRVHALGEDTATPPAIDAVGCRVVHGGGTLVEPTRVTASVLATLRALQPLAPLHLPADIAVLEQVQKSLSGTPVVAVFDTAFHQTLPTVASTYALPVDLSARHGLRRFGFHGISHAYVSERAIELLGRGANGTRIITCHLGNGASICAVRDGRSIDTSMGLTPMEGLVMGTRAGDVDPGLVLYLIRTAGMSASEVDDLLNHQSGLRGLSGRSADVRELEQATLNNDTRAELALEIFAYRACKYIGAFAAALEGLDAVVFTGGIGEHSNAMRSRICQRLAFLGVRLDEERNRAANGRALQIGAEENGVRVWVMPTDEEGAIARSTVERMNANYV